MNCRPSSPDRFAFDVAIAAHRLLAAAVAPLLPAAAGQAWRTSCTWVICELSDAAATIETMRPGRRRRAARRCWRRLTKLTHNSRGIAAKLLSSEDFRQAFIQQTTTAE